ncbi:hypothetical protein Leryth_014694, partial [Lithospermum erythrorhizon]
YRNHSEKEFPPQGANTSNFPGKSEKHLSEASDPSLDAMKQFNMSYLKTSQGNKNQLNGTTHVAKLHAVPGFTYFVNEPPSKQKTESGVPIPPIKSEVNHTWSFSGSIPNENNRKTKRLSPANPPAVGASGTKDGSWVGSQSKDRSFSGSESYLKSQSFKADRSSNHPLEPCGIRGHPKRSKSSNVSSKDNPFEKSTGTGTDSSDEEFDINSDAAACAAALKSVLEKAQESIRLAKEMRERGEKDGIQRFSNLSSERSSKAKDKTNGFGEANSSKKQNVKDRHERLGSQSHESNVTNKRICPTSTGVSTASERSHELLTSTVPAKAKSRLNNTEAEGKSKQFLDLADIRKNVSSTSESDQAEMDKRTTFPSMRKQESVTSLSFEKQKSVVVETTTEETSEQIENNGELEKSTEKDFRMSNVENNKHVDEQTKVSQVTAHTSGSAAVKNEFRTSVGLEITEKDARSEDMKCILDESSHYEIKSPECLHMSEENKSESSKIEYQKLLNESQNLAEEEEPCEGFQQVQLELSFIYSQEEMENGLYSCNEGGMIQQEACGFVAIDAPEVCGSGSRESILKDSREGEACGTSNGLDSCNEGGVQQDACGFVASDDAPKVCCSGIQEKTHKDSQEGEARGTSNAILEIGSDYSELICEHKVDEAPTVSYEELNKKVVEDLDHNEKNLVHGLHVEKGTKVPKEEHQEGEHQKRSEETNNNVKAGWNAVGEEYNCGEVEKGIKKECIVEYTELVWLEKYKIASSQNAVERIQDTEETTGVHVQNDNFDNDELADLPQKSAQDKNIDADAYVSLHDVQEAHSTGVVEDHESSNSTTGTSEEFYNCESEGNSEEALKACELENIQSHFEDRVSTSETPAPFLAVESDGNGINADHNGSRHEHKLLQEDVLETTYFVQNAEKDNDIRLNLQDVSEDQKATNVNFSEHVNEEVSFDKEAEDVDPKAACQVENKEKEMDQTNSSAVTDQATVNHGYLEEMITGQNIQFVRGKPEKNVLPEDNEARESSQKDLKEKEHLKKIEAMKKERERDKDRIAVERAIREARERAFAEARERAERVAVARAGAEVRQRMMTEAREKLEKASAGTKLADKASIVAKQRAERAAVERATAEARERALEKALSQKSTAQGRVQTDRHSGTPKDSSLKHSFSSSDIDMFDGNNSESAQRRKARLERHERIMERAAKALAEKNMRDLQAQKEQAERNRLAESLDADVKRWANGKEGNLRALLSTLQYILGHNSGWQPISLTELITTAAVKKGFRKATLYVHPDKLQQRGASIQQKYVCEKVFDLLKVAWSKFNSEER